MEKSMELENKKQDLKHLSFVRVAAIHALVCLSNMYAYAKQKSGPLRSTVATVEGAVTTIAGPVYQEFKDVPDHILAFLDKKFDEHAPESAKQVVSQAQDLVHKAAQRAQKLVDEARTNGAKGALHYGAAELKQFVLVNSTKLWINLTHNSAFHSVAEKVIPTATHLSEKYNCVVKDLSGKGYPVVSYLPLMPGWGLGEAVKAS